MVSELVGLWIFKWLATSSKLLSDKTAEKKKTNQNDGLKMLELCWNMTRSAFKRRMTPIDVPKTITIGKCGYEISPHVIHGITCPPETVLFQSFFNSCFLDRTTDSAEGAAGRHWEDISIYLYTAFERYEVGHMCRHIFPLQTSYLG